MAGSGASGTNTDLEFYNYNLSASALSISRTTSAATFAGAVTTQSGRIIATAGKTASYTLTTSDHFVVFSGSTAAQSLTLPAVSGTAGRRYEIKNRASVTVNVVTTGAANEIFSTSAVNSVTLSTGNSIILTSDGTYWNLQ